MEEEAFKELTKECLIFLVKEYNFRYDTKKNYFDNDNFRIYVEHHDKHIPSILLWKRSEPKFTSALLDWLLEDFFVKAETDKSLLEDTFHYYSRIFRQNADYLFSEFDHLLLQKLKKRFIAKKKREGKTKDNYHINLSPDQRKYYHYIKKKDSEWNPSKEL